MERKVIFVPRNSLFGWLINDAQFVFVFVFKTKDNHIFQSNKTF